MKFLALVVLVFGLVLGTSATSHLHAALDKSVEDVIEAFEAGMMSAPALSEAVSETTPEADGVDSDSKSQLAKALREALEDTINKIKEKIDDKHQKAQDLLAKANELVEKLKQLKANVGDKAREMLDSYKDKVKGLFDSLIEKIRGNNRSKRDVSEEVILDQLNLSSLLEKVRAKLREHVSVEKLSQYVRELFGRFNPLAQEFIRTLHARGQETLTRIVDNLLAVLKSRETRGIKDIAQKVRDFLATLGENVRDKYSDFAEWLNDIWNRGVDHAKDRVGRLREVAREVTTHAKEMHKETIREAVEALRPFKDELGSMWQDLLTAARDALKRHD
jgi:F0F1-type ATP synthase membrane subunit b/b'